MNRHQRRAAAAGKRSGGVDAGFDAYRDLVRKVVTKATDAQIGEGWMRGVAADAAGMGVGADFLHPPGETPKADADDVIISADFGVVGFRARVSPKNATALPREWEKVLAEVNPENSRDFTRNFIMRGLVENKQWQAQMGCALAWLAWTSPLGEALGAAMFGPHQRVHFEITKVPRGANFHLVAGNSNIDVERAADLLPVPQWTAPGESK